MAIFKKLFNFYINGSIHVALSVYALTWMTLMEFNIVYDEAVLYFVFYATITGYNFVKYFGLAKFHHRSLAYWLKLIQIFSLVCFMLMCFYAYQLQVNTLFCIVGFAIVTFLYAIPFLPKHLFLDSKDNLRSVGGLKIYLIAFIWSGVTVFLPLINNDYVIDIDVMITAIQRYLFVIVIMFPFEIRDLNYDSLKLSTIPQKIGIKHTKNVGYILLVFFFVLQFFKIEINAKKLMILILLTLTTGLFLICSKKEQSTYYSSFWVESLPILWLISTMCFEF